MFNFFASSLQQQNVYVSVYFENRQWFLCTEVTAVFASLTPNARGRKLLPRILVIGELYKLGNPENGKESAKFYVAMFMWPVKDPLALYTYTHTFTHNVEKHWWAYCT